MDNYIDKILKNDIYDYELIKLFYLNPVKEELFLDYTIEELSQVAKKVFAVIIKTNCKDILNIIEANRGDISELHASNIPQFSRLEDVFDILDMVKTNPDSTFSLFGYFFNKNSSKVAQTKYGENHYKVASQLGLTTKEKPLMITFLGNYYLTLHESEKEILKIKLFLLIPIIQKILIEAKYNKCNVLELLQIYLSNTTALRRRPNIKRISYLIIDYCNNYEHENFYNLKCNLLWK